MLQFFQFPFHHYPTARYSCACSTMLCIEPIAASTPATPYTIINVMLNQSSTPLGFLACTGAGEAFSLHFALILMQVKADNKTAPLEYSPFMSAGSQMGCVCHFTLSVKGPTTEGEAGSRAAEEPHISTVESMGTSQELQHWLLTLIHRAGGIRKVSGMRPIEPTSLHTQFNELFRTCC